MISLFLLVSGVDAGLDHISRSVTQSNYTLYNSKGAVVASYTGDLNLCRPNLRQTSITSFVIIHRS